MKTLRAPVKTGQILNFFLVCMLLFLARIWYLSMIQYEHYHALSQKPRTKTVIEKPERGTIRDRFNTILAHNAPQYNVAICYADVRQIPSIQWVTDESGKKVRVLARRKYIEQFSQFLAEQLEMDPLDIEDLIHGKACLFPHTPFVVKEDISESLYYRLKGAEKDWPSLSLMQSEKRVYPLSKLACDVIGYMGAINQQEYFDVGREMKELRLYLKDYAAGEPVFLPKGFKHPDEVKLRLNALEERAYTIHDQLGKSGVEASLDSVLRGTIGKSFYEVDIAGNTLRKLPGGNRATSGKRVVLTLSAELQMEAERLLAEYEFLQSERDKTSPKKRKIPFERGGAIVAIEPNTGEVLALASHPRFDPNDLVPMQTVEKRGEKEGQILKWLESPQYIGEIWDGRRPLEKELYKGDRFQTEKVYLSWESFLGMILDEQCQVRKVLREIRTVQQAVCFDESMLDGIRYERDQCLLLDLLSLVVPKDAFSTVLLEKIGDQSLEEFRFFSQLASREIPHLKKQARIAFHKGAFRTWREENFQEMLKQKRKEEKARHTWARPYTDYLEQEEKKMFAAYWEENRAQLLLREVRNHPDLSAIKERIAFLTREEQLTYIKTLRCFDDLNEPLQGQYPMLRKEQGVHLQKHLASAFYPYNGFGYGRSQAFRQATPMGSIFKVIPAYAGLKHMHDLGREDLNPLRLVDDMQWTSKPGSNSQILGYFPNGEPIKRFYKGGRLPRAYPKIGELDVTSALERTSNIYFSILAGDVLESPTTLLQTAMDFGLGSKTNIDLPGEYKGSLPDDLLHNKTGLYSFAIGQHSLVVTPLQAAMMFSAIANQGLLLKPQIVKYQIDTKNVECSEPEVLRKVPLPDPIRNQLLSGMHKVINGEKGTARPALIRKAFHDKAALAAYEVLSHQMVGKTGTAEIYHKETIDAETKAEMEKHVWFGSIGFKEDTLETPELVVVVFSRFGSAGKQGAPIAARMLQKWREICQYHYNPDHEE